MDEQSEYKQMYLLLEKRRGLEMNAIQAVIDSIADLRMLYARTDQAVDTCYVEFGEKKEEEEEM